MKVKATAYSFTVCLVSATVLLVYLDFSVLPEGSKNHFLNDVPHKPISEKLHDIRPVETSGYLLKPAVHKLQSRQKFEMQITTMAVPTTSDDSSSAPPVPLSTAHIIAVVSYMRSGSSLTGDILQHFARTLYVFEPLHTVTRRTIEGKPLVYLNGKKIVLKPENLTDEFITQELHKWFQCRFDDLDIYSLADSLHQQFSRSMRSLTECWKRKHRTVKAMRLCLPDIIKKCLNAKQRLFKFIRLPMRIIQKVFNLYPNMQLIHLIRDPRGSLTSQIKVNKSSWSDISLTSKAYCDRVTEDLNTTVRLNYNDSKRARVLVYENLAEHPINTATRLYNYVGMPVMKSVLEYVRKLTLDGRKKRCLYCVVKSNSTLAAYSWRDVVRYQDVLTIDNNCPVVYGYMGYQRLTLPSDVADRRLATHRTPNTSIII